MFSLTSIFRRLVKHVAIQNLIRSYLHTITRHQAYIEVSLWIKIKQKDLETRIDHAPTCVRFIRKKGRGHRQESRYPDRKG